MPFDPDDPRLTAFALGELDLDDRAAIEAILRDDPDARDFVQGVEETARLLADEFRHESMSTPGLDPGRRVAIEERLASAPSPATIPITSAPARTRLRLLLPLAAVAGILGLAVAVTLPSYLASRRAQVELAWNGVNDIAPPSGKAPGAESRDKGLDALGETASSAAGEPARAGKPADNALGETSASPAARELALNGRPAGAVARGFGVQSAPAFAGDAPPLPAAVPPAGVLASTRSESEAAPLGAPSSGKGLGGMGGGMGGMGGGMGGRGDQAPFVASKAYAPTMAPVDGRGLNRAPGEAGAAPGVGGGRYSTLATTGSNPPSPRGDVSEQIFEKSKGVRYRLDASAAQNTPVAAGEAGGRRAGVMPGTDRNGPAFDPNRDHTAGNRLPVVLGTQPGGVANFTPNLNVPFTQGSAAQNTPFNAVAGGAQQAPSGGGGGQSQLSGRMAQQNGAMGRSQPGEAASNFARQAPMNPGQQVAMREAQASPAREGVVNEGLGAQPGAQANLQAGLHGMPAAANPSNIPGANPNGASPTSLAYAKDFKDLSRSRAELNPQLGQQNSAGDAAKPNQAGPPGHNGPATPGQQPAPAVASAPQPPQNYSFYVPAAQAPAVQAEAKAKAEGFLEAMHDVDKAAVIEPGTTARHRTRVGRCL